MQEKALKCIISCTTSVFDVFVVNKKNYVEKRQLREPEREHKQKTNGIVRARQLIIINI